jgi:hypothetical protein
MSGTQEEKPREETERGEKEVNGGNSSRQAQRQYTSGIG